MKKYLMIAVAALAIVSCSKSEDVSDPDQVAKNQVAQIKANYQEAFVKAYGQIQPGHNWGFGVVTTKGITRAVDANANEWGDNYYNVPAPLTAQQIKVVTDWFTANRNPEGVAIDYTDSFAQQVSSTSYGAGMDYLTCGADDEHIYNFNKGDEGTYDKVFDGKLTKETIGQDYNDRKKAVYYEDKIEHMVSSSTSRFGYWCSSDSKMYYDYVIIPGEEISPIVAGRYFVAFDYQQVKADGTEIVNKDGYFNDWIISITPGIKKLSHARVIAEDLSATEKGDFDFNDVVFDVYFENNSTTITILAAGGTLPLTVAGQEVHKLFGVWEEGAEKQKMVNTGATGGVTKDPVSFTINGNNYGWDAKNIPVVVTKNGQNIALEAEQGYAPGKIQVEKYYQWCGEREDIGTKYPLFLDYVKDQNVKWY